MKFSAVTHPDILHHLLLLDLRHVLELILSYLDLETLAAVEMVSPLWSWLVHSSNTIYRNKVIVWSVSSNNTFLAGPLHPSIIWHSLPGSLKTAMSWPQDISSVWPLWFLTFQWWDSFNIVKLPIFLWWRHKPLWSFFNKTRSARITILYSWRKKLSRDLYG